MTPSAVDLKSLLSCSSRFRCLVHYHNRATRKLLNFSLGDLSCIGGTCIKDRRWCRQMFHTLNWPLWGLCFVLYCSNGLGPFGHKCLDNLLFDGWVCRAGRSILGKISRWWILYYLDIELYKKVYLLPFEFEWDFSLCCTKGKLSMSILAPLQGVLA